MTSSFTGVIKTRCIEKNYFEIFYFYQTKSECMVGTVCVVQNISQILYKNTQRENAFSQTGGRDNIKTKEHKILVTCATVLLQ